MYWQEQENMYWASSSEQNINWMKKCWLIWEHIYRIQDRTLPKDPKRQYKHITNMALRSTEKVQAHIKCCRKTEIAIVDSGLWD